MSDPHARLSIITALRQRLSELDLDAFILPRFDAHQGEYVTPRDERLAYVTGFTGSAGMAIVAEEEVAMFVDGRYSVQLRGQCAGGDFTYHHLIDTPAENWLAQHAQSGWRVGYDAMHLPPAWYDRFATACAAQGAEMVAVASNPVDDIWQDQPEPPLGQVTPFSTQFAGRSSADKCAVLAEQLASRGLDLMVETQLDNIAWLLNVRGDDIAFNPMPQSFLMASGSGAVASSQRTMAASYAAVCANALRARPRRAVASGPPAASCSTSSRPPSLTLSGGPLDLDLDPGPALLPRERAGDPRAGTRDAVATATRRRRSVQVDLSSTTCGASQRPGL